jgi:hydroxymethylpyrimidine pyrophosphatase-like HAD family hydrolase
LIEVDPHESVDLARYGWARDLLLKFSSLRNHMLAEAEAAASGGAEGAPEAQLNLLLLLCAAEQLAADHLARGALELSSVRRFVRRDGLTSALLNALENASATLCSVRASMADHRTVHRLGVVRAMALTVAESVARGDASTAIEPSAIAEVFADAEPELANSRMKIPSCFRAQDLTAADCFELAARFETESGACREILVVGVRTSGSYMAPLVAGWLRTRGCEAAYTTLRPKAPFVSAERALIRRFRSCPVLIVDDPPMTGASYLRTARRLEECGVDRDAITLLVPVGAENALGAEALSQLAAYRRVELPHNELAVRRQLESSELLAFIASAAGRPGAAVRPVFSPDEVEGHSRRRHVKQVYDVPGCRVHVKGVGLAWFGYPARHAALALAGRIPEPLGFWKTLMATREEPEMPQARPPFADVADYVAKRSRGLRVMAQRPSLKFQKDGFYRLAKVLARVHGPLAPLSMGRVRRLLVNAASDAPASLIDGRMGVEEWLGQSPALKRDFEEHAFDKDDLGLYDAAYDLAGAVLELGPGRDLEAALVNRYIELSGDAGVRSRLSLALLLYGAFLLERRSWEIEGQRGTSGWSAAVQAWLDAEAAMSWATDRFLGDAFPGRRALPASVVWSIDVDGVLEDAGLGFSATTPNGALALQVAREAGAAVVLNSGRSLPELVLRCDALYLDGAVAEYGSAIWDPVTGVSESLLDADEAAGLERVRGVALGLSDVHVDSRYKHSVRLRRFVQGRARSLETSEIECLLKAGSGQVSAVQGVRQTDFIGAARDKFPGLERLRQRMGWRGEVFAMGDAEPDLAVARHATRAYAPRHCDDTLAGVAIHLRADRQKAVLEAVRREHGSRSKGSFPSWLAADSALVKLLALRDAPRPWRAVRAFGPGLVEVFRT